MIGAIDTQRAIGSTQEAVEINHQEILNTSQAVEITRNEVLSTVGVNYQEIVSAVEVKHQELVSARKPSSSFASSQVNLCFTGHLDQLPHVDEAFFNHISRNDAPTCVPGSRDALLEKIQRWAESSEVESPPIFWLSGIAGTGKSTVAQTVCMNATELKTLGATFFFSQQAGQRRVATAVFPTLVHQLLSNAHSPIRIKTSILASLDKNPSAGSQILKIQFEKLILEPFRNLTIPHPIILVLDALDECAEDGVKEILNLITSNLDQLPSFLKIFVTSRPESHISDILKPRNPNPSQHRRFVVYQQVIDPSSDESAVQVYFKAALSNAEVVRLFPAFDNWTLDEAKMTSLVGMTEGLFIVAATIVKFILNSADANPDYCLSLLLQDPESKNQTHSAINLLYIKILEHRYPTNTGKTTLDRFRSVVGTIVLLYEPLSVESLGQLLGLTPQSIHSALHRLQSVVAITEADGLIRPLHPSFVDFLTNQHACPLSFLIEPKLQHAFVAQHCVFTMNKLFNISQVITKADITPEVTYALCYFDDHIVGSGTNSQNEFFSFIKAFIESRVGKWLVALFHSGRSSHAIPSVKQLCGWVV